MCKLNLQTKVPISVLNILFFIQSSILTVNVSTTEPQLREQMSGPNLHVFTVKFLALKKVIFPHKIYFPNYFCLLFTFVLCNFSVQTLKYFQKYFQIIFFSIKTLKNRPKKLLIIGPNPYISQSSPDHSPQPRIDFSYYEISGPDICSLICGPGIPYT
jgi:hypothetical protein